MTEIPEEPQAEKGHLSVTERLFVTVFSQLMRSYRIYRIDVGHTETQYRKYRVKKTGEIIKIPAGYTVMKLHGLEPQKTASNLRQWVDNAGLGSRKEPTGMRPAEEKGEEKCAV